MESFTRVFGIQQVLNKSYNAFISIIIATRTSSQLLEGRRSWKLGAGAFWNLRGSELKHSPLWEHEFEILC